MMTHGSLSHQLASLRAGFKRDLEAYDEEIAARSQEQGAILVQLEGLRHRLEVIAAESVELLSKKESTIGLHHRAQMETVLRAFTVSADSLAAHCLCLAEVSELRERRERLLRDDVDLAAAVQSYRDFERDKDRLLSALPMLYRSGLLQEHERLRERVAPLLEGETREAQLLEDMVATLPIVVVDDREQNMMVYWLMPFPANLLHHAEMAPPCPESDMAAAVLATVESMARSEEWYFAELETGAWAGYAAISALAEYTGKATVAELTRAALDAGLREQVPGLQIETVEISVAAWRYGCELTPATETVPGERQMPEVPATHDILDERMQGGWYRRADVESWNRPLKVKPGSQWNQQARRLRTLLVRMVANGIVGGAWVDAEQLTAGLPQTHAAALREGIDRLLEAGVLQLVDGDSHVTMNPSLLEEVQNLINRDATEFWHPIISNSGPSALLSTEGA